MQQPLLTFKYYDIILMAYGLNLYLYALSFFDGRWASVFNKLLTYSPILMKVLLCLCKRYTPIFITGFIFFLYKHIIFPKADWADVSKSIIRWER